MNREFDNGFDEEEERLRSRSRKRDLGAGAGADSDTMPGAYWEAAGGDKGAGQAGRAGSGGGSGRDAGTSGRASGRTASEHRLFGCRAQLRFRRPSALPELERRSRTAGISGKNGMEAPAE